MTNMIKEMRIETSRLIIRPFIQSDLLECFELIHNAIRDDCWNINNISSINISDID